MGKGNRWLHSKNDDRGKGHATTWWISSLWDIIIGHTIERHDWKFSTSYSSMIFNKTFQLINLDHHLCADVTIISHTNKQMTHYLFSLFIYFKWYVYFCVQLLRGCFWKKKMCLTIMWYIRHIVICNSLFQCGKQFGGGSSFGWINHLI